jgi:2-polyprenyl-3-methyl-5-hydroxy-6-metoxy-1,4-benzoquinol methylase
VALSGCLCNIGQVGAPRREGQLASIYETTVDEGAENNPHTFTLDIVGYNKRVLEVGCASGYFTKALKDRGCQVVGIELDAGAAAVAEKWAERVIVGDLDAATLWQQLEGEHFDAITFGDVLEHLRDPLSCLRAAVHYLKPSGIVAISVPNVAHGDVRMALLQGQFPYRDWGLLDRTHIRFFTKAGLRDMIKAAGLVLVETRRVIKPLFQTELGIERRGVPQETINSILEDTEAETYQFVVKAVQDNGTRTLATLADRVTELTDRAHDEVVRTALIRKEMHELEKRSQEQEKTIEELQRLERELVSNRDAIRDVRRELQDARRESSEYRGQLLDAEQRIAAIVNTKTFRLAAPLRELYGKVRRAL